MTIAAPPEAARQDYRYFESVRALAAQGVVIGHALNLFLPSVFMRMGPEGTLEARAGVFFIQNLGVGAFFVISGYLVTLSAMRTHQRVAAGFEPFLIGRFRRIYGPLVPLLILVFVVENLVYPDHARLATIVVVADIPTLIVNLLLLVDHPLMAVASRVTGLPFLRASAIGTAAQLWTVFIEWWIYVVFGAAYFSIVERRTSLIRLALLLIALPVPLYWLVKGNALPLAWIVGMAFALGDERARRLPVTATAIACLACCALATARAFATSWPFYDPLVLVPASAAVMLGFYLAPGASAGKSWLAAVTGYFSDRSYSLYLVHLSILTAVADLADTVLDQGDHCHVRRCDLRRQRGRARLPSDI